MLGRIKNHIMASMMAWWLLVAILAASAEAAVDRVHDHGASTHSSAGQVDYTAEAGHPAASEAILHCEHCGHVASLLAVDCGPRTGFAPIEAFRQRSPARPASPWFHAPPVPPPIG